MRVIGNMTIDEAATLFELRNNLYQAELSLFMLEHSDAKWFMTMRKTFTEAIKDARKLIREATELINEELPFTDEVDIEEEFDLELRMRGEDIEF